MTNASVSQAMSTLDIVKRVSLCLAYIVVSASLIRFNKFLMNKDRFPYSMLLTSCHMSMSFSLCLVLYLVKPGAFPGVANSEGRKLLVLKWMAPIGVAFSVSLYTSNQAYMYCSVTFLQFMKEGNVIIAFLMSCAAGLQAMNRVRCAIIAWIIAGSAMAVSGEVNFVFVGFVYQLISQLAECSRAVMGEVVLSGGGLKLDPLSYTLFVAPACLAVLVGGIIATWDPAIPGALAKWWPYLLPNALLAFVLNMLVATIIKEMSAVGFILAGVCKDIALVLFSAVVFAEVVTAHQCFGFMVALGGVFFWSFLRASPDSQAAMLAARLLQMPPESKMPNENTVLLPQTSSTKV
eukprot:CAMPEP_0183393914 /NCGR_PEP_ID=MMETSP0370-20130417/8212_1 /TAXON_ID=268820 /ORGANISM="Peridinium aciculiferum, Strain PAER-2" /LENGTH=348 /DNA_ID=CAMNT_0025574193 /DNA_START=92 /DNA_END=1138 /DNA_ORIENTATION=-